MQDRLEEPHGAGIFWNLSAEIYPALVEGMNEASILAGDPEVRSALITLGPGNTAPGMPLFVYAMPAASLLIVRLDTVGGGAIKKVFVRDLDRHYPGWESDSGPVIRRWFPVGMTLFGVYPTLQADQQVLMTTIGFAMPNGQPYSGSEIIPFREEYLDGFQEYAAHVCRLKEAGPDFQESIPSLQAFQDKMVQLTKFAARRGISRFTKLGRQAQVNNVAVK